jgi:hypothetical protein
MPRWRILLKLAIAGAIFLSPSHAPTQSPSPCETPTPVWSEGIPHVEPGDKGVDSACPATLLTFFRRTRENVGGPTTLWSGRAATGSITLSERPPDTGTSKGKPLPASGLQTKIGNGVAGQGCPAPVCLLRNEASFALATDSVASDTILINARAPHWSAIRHNGTVEPVTLQWTDRVPVLRRAQSRPADLSLADVQLLRPPRLSRPGPPPLAPLLILANGDRLTGWPTLNTAGHAASSSTKNTTGWSIDTPLFPRDARTRQPLTLHRSAIHRLEFAAAAALFTWPNAPEPTAPPALLHITQPQPGENRLSSRSASLPTRIEFQVLPAASPAEWSILSGDQPLAALSFGKQGDNTVHLSGTAFRRPEPIGPNHPTESTTVVWEQGAFGWRLWLDSRLIAEQTSPLPAPLAFHWRQRPAADSPWQQVRVWQPYERPLTPRPVPQTDLDSFERTTGDLLYGEVTSLTANTAQFDSVGHRTDLALSDLAALQFAHQEPPIHPCQGWIGDLTLISQTAPWRVAVSDITLASWTIQHPLLGEHRLPVESIASFAPRARGEYHLLAAGSIHLGDETRPDLTPPVPVGLLWSTNVRPPAPGQRVLFTAHVRDLAPTAPVGNSQILLDGQPVATLNAAPRDGATRQVTLELPAGRFSRPLTRLEVRVDRPTGQSGAADDWELVNPSVLFVEPE